MSVIVKGMDIPKGCEYCPFNGHTKCRMMPIGFDEYPLIGRRPDWCPLVEIPTPHGRLIDAEKLKRHIDKLPALPDGNFAGTHRNLKALINMQKAVIEAEWSDG